MITRDQLYILDYYKKNTYMGSSKMLNYRVHKVEEEEEKYLETICWKGPFIFDKTPDDEKVFKKFEYSDKGLDDIVDYLNEQSDLIEEKGTIL